MRHFPAVLLGALVLALVAAGVACGGDDKEPTLGNGPADDIHGTWEGQYMAFDGSQNGTFCVKFDQDGRALSGKVSFNGGGQTTIGGAIAGSQFNFVWGAGLLASSSPSDSTNIELGGTMSGTDANGTASGTWIATSTHANGDWTASHTDADGCP